MTKNPLVNAAAATGYIVLIACVMFFGVEKVPSNTVVIPVIVLSLFTLSAAVMAYVFMYQPLLLVLAGKRKEGLDLFLKTIAVFAITTVTIVVLFSSRILH